MLAGFALAAIVVPGGDDPGHRAGPVAATASAPSQRLPLGLTEFNAQLLRPAGARGRAGLPTAPAAFASMRGAVTALHPRYVRIVVDWLRVGADPSGRPDLAIRQNGCVRDLPPCAGFDGLRAQLQAVRERQRREGGWEAVVAIAWTPEWAARPAGGCERPGTTARSRPITTAGQAA